MREGGRHPEFWKLKQQPVGEGACQQGAWWMEYVIQLEWGVEGALLLRFGSGDQNGEGRSQNHGQEHSDCKMRSFL